MMKNANDERIEKVMAQLKDHSMWTYRHVLRVVDYALEIGEAANLSSDMMEKLRVAAMLHDTGKLTVPASVLDKSEKLTDEEFAMLKSHTQAGYDILKGMGFDDEICEAVRDHHERFDGRGYGKKEEISLIAAIIVIADSFDAMTADRPYKKGKSLKEAEEDLKWNMGKQFDPRFAFVADSFFEIKAA